MAKAIELQERLEDLRIKIESAAKADTPEEKLLLAIIWRAILDLTGPKLPEYVKIDAALFLQSGRCAAMANLITLDMGYVDRMISKYLPEIKEQMVTREDAELIRRLVSEREAINDNIKKLRAQVAALSNEAIADKFDFDVDQVRHIIKATAAPMDR